MSEMGERWRNLAEGDKAVFTQRHKDAMVEWEAAGGKAVDAARRAEKKAAKAAKAEAGGKGGKAAKGAKAAGKGSKGPTGFTLFSSEKRPEVKAGNPELYNPLLQFRCSHRRDPESLASLHDKELCFLLVRW